MNGVAALPRNVSNTGMTDSFLFYDLETFGADPVAILVIVDRGGTCGALAAARDIPFLALLTAEDLGFGYGT